ncbi:hypothetical protein Psta_0640 [Pirellula staleyi DSM 6068]|uniref:Uncharacterized protein n=1 Tax=Pirellula staleyi (strain ATCC 27377 / DSM 6068 / ICPB 4128) TaxID=530564 RepID=D2R4H8_PIRSD|nr:LURP-one-related family protein [Pirellula staleyi]ADB15326.1 hypothetical protein Psta_0640 [Pirellula staleyi DSM 6068]
MKYLIEQKLLAWGDDFTIRDAEGKQIYFVDGQGISFGNKLSFEDLEKQQLAFIEQRVWAWGNEYDIERDGTLLARVSRKSASNSQAMRFFVDVPGPEDLEAVGNFIARDYKFIRHNVVVATVQSDESTGGIFVDVPGNEDAVLLLSAVIVIDLVSQEPVSSASLFRE